MNLKSRLVTFVDWFDDKPYDLQTSGTTGSLTIRTEKQAMVNSALATGDF
jgi:O-succinylbenzoic acid--CoA ligase